MTLTAMGTFVLVLTIGIILVVTLLLYQEKTGKGLGTPVLAALIGLLLGASLAAAGVQLMGYEIIKSHPMDLVVQGVAGASTDLPPDTGGMGGMMGGMGGMMGGGGGGPSPKQELSSAVRKIDLLTSGIALELAPEQIAQLTAVLQRIQDQDTMSDDEAAAFHEEIESIMTEDQLAVRDAIDLPRPRRGGGGGGGGGGPPPTVLANPFSDGNNAESLNALVSRFAAK